MRYVRLRDEECESEGKKVSEEEEEECEECEE